jgi:hypothetical protein
MPYVVVRPLLHSLVSQHDVSTWPSELGHLIHAGVAAPQDAPQYPTQDVDHVTIYT